MTWVRSSSMYVLVFHVVKFLSEAEWINLEFAGYRTRMLVCAYSRSYWSSVIIRLFRLVIV
jgi:hypothetical protein